MYVCKNCKDQEKFMYKIYKTYYCNKNGQVINKEEDILCKCCDDGIHERIDNVRCYKCDEIVIWEIWEKGEKIRSSQY